MKKSILADSTLVLIAFIWGTTFVVVQNAINSISPYAFNGWRFLIAALVLLVWILLFKREVFRKFRIRMVLPGLLLGVFLFLGYVFQTVGLLYTSSSKAAFITGLSVVLVPVLSYFILKIVPTRMAVFGVVVATIGLYLLSVVKDMSLHLGDVLVFFCAIAFGLHIVVTAKLTRVYSAFILTIIQLLTVSILSFISGVLLKGAKTTFDPSFLFQKEVFSAVLFTAVFATAFAYLLQTTLQRYTTPTHVGLIFIMEPVFAALTAFVWQHETMSMYTKMGCLLILGGMLLAEVPISKKQRQEQPAKG